MTGLGRSWKPKGLSKSGGRSCWACAAGDGPATRKIAKELNLREKRPPAGGPQEVDDGLAGLSRS